MIKFDFPGWLLIISGSGLIWLYATNPAIRALVNASLGF